MTDSAGRGTSEDLLADIASNGLLLERETEQYSFAHHTFQEYLAAEHIRDKQLLSVLVSSVNDIWWRETTLLYAARNGADADLIVRTCLDAATITSLALAFDCAEQCGTIDADLRSRLDHLLDSGLSPGTAPERRRLIAGVLLARHLTQRVTIASGSRVCLRPISTDLYRLFQVDAGAALPGTPPDAQQQTAFGMSGSDATAFARWANVTSGGQVAYRLPRTTELDDTALHGPLSMGPEVQQHGAWVTQESEIAGSAPALWAPRSASHPLQVDATTLAECTRNDIARSIPTMFRALIIRSLVDMRASNQAGISYHDYNNACELATSVAAGDGGADGAARSFGKAIDLIRVLDSALIRTRKSSQRVRFRLHVYSVESLVHAEREVAERNASEKFRKAIGTLAAAGHLDELGRALGLDCSPDFNSVYGRFSLRHEVDFHDKLAVRSAHAMGWSLSGAIAATIGDGATGSSWATSFPQALAAHVRLGDHSRFPDPETLGARLTDAVAELCPGAVGQGESGAMTSWAATVAQRLLKTAILVFDRREPATASAATSIRLAALCLAGEADQLDQGDLAERFRDIAAGITLLELRHAGRRPAAGTILLALD